MSKVRIKIFECITSRSQLEWYMNEFLKNDKVSYVSHGTECRRDPNVKYKRSWYSGSIAYTKKEG